VILADVNVWLATVVEAHPDHARAVRWWSQVVLPARRTVFFCRVTQMGLLRLLWSEVVMGPARRTPAEAWRDYQQLLSQPPVAFMSEPEDLEERLRTITVEGEPSASMWTDAYLASFALEAELCLATFDRGFRRFDGLNLRLIASA
jgi:toxin-antitoxin system PIN domain toxin